jgi:CRISPR-associated exonuclease Cas4
MLKEDQFIPISALQHWLYCPRQCALIHLEQAWAENRFTAEGRVLHENAHEGADETKAEVRITRGMPVASGCLGLAGQCDVVEFHAAGRLHAGGRRDLKFEISDLRRAGGDLKFGISDLRGSDAGGDLKFEISDLRGRDAGGEAPFKSQISSFKSALRAVPVEYKRGKPKAHRADEVQLCAQAMCLEEMLGIVIPAGALYYGEKRRRTEVVFDQPLRDLVRKTTEEVRACFASGRTPLAEYEPRRCDACSLIDFCQPHSLRFKKGAAAWFSSSLKSEISNLKSTQP